MRVRINVDLPTFLVPHTRITAQPSISPMNERSKVVLICQHFCQVLLVFIIIILPSDSSNAMSDFNWLKFVSFRLFLQPFYVCLSLPKLFFYYTCKSSYWLCDV